MNTNKSETNMTALCDLIETLRGENGCPWDRKQTPGSMAAYLLEETYELVEAIEKGDPDEIRGELGDVLFLVLFVARLYHETGDFGISDVADHAYNKMVRRHPHVFGGEKAANAEEVKQRWHKIKQAENTETPEASILDSVSTRLPALMRAFRISERAARTGFDWDDIAEVMLKVEEEWAELKEELADSSPGPAGRERTALEFGDVLFTLVNVARFAEIHPEMALSDSIRKFKKRFKHMEKVTSTTGRPLEAVSHAEKHRIWEEAKKLV